MCGNNFGGSNFGGNNYGGGFGQNSFQQMPPKKPKKPWKGILACVICALLILSAIINIVIFSRDTGFAPEYTFEYTQPDYTWPDVTFHHYTIPEHTYEAPESKPVSTVKIGQTTSGSTYTKPEPTPEIPVGFFGTDAEISYVMIYNPNIYSEKLNYNATRSTGDISKSIEAVMSKGDGLETEQDRMPTPASYLQNDFGDVEFASDKAGAFITPYYKGQKKDFYYGHDLKNRRNGTFECRYAGTYCNIWTNDGSVNNSTVNDLGYKFDTVIYNRVVSTFGKSRFAENGGKVNILIYNMNNQGLGGFFWSGDSFARNEITDAQIYAAGYSGLNFDHDIININTQAFVFDGKEEYIVSTLAHEYQHCINYSNAVNSVSQYEMSSWLNESMSGYIEEEIFPGIQLKSGRNKLLVSSNRIRYGQSLYNFANDMNIYNMDAGVYGSVYYFSQYLENLAGDDVFAKISQNHRTKYSNSMSEALIIAESVPSSVYSKISGSVNFDSLYFASADEEWLSKLTLDYYISMMKYDYGTDPACYNDFSAYDLLYDRISAANIEGGGRIIVALKNGKFEIPTNASSGLCYVAFDKNFNRVGNIVVR